MKKLLILLSLSALVFGCDKHNDDYKNNIPEWHPYVPEEKPEEEKTEYTLEEVKKYLDIYGMKHQLIDRYIQGYTTASSLNVSHTLAKDGSEHYFYITFNGNTICGGQYKGDPCDPGFNELADKFGDTYGPHDVVKMEDYFIRATINNIKYYLYVTQGDYDDSHKEGSLLNDLIESNYQKLFRYEHLYMGDWTRTLFNYWHLPLQEFNKLEEPVIGKYVSLDLKCPPKAGTYSFHLVAESEGKIICDQTFENVELPARKE